MGLARDCHWCHLGARVVNFCALNGATRARQMALEATCKLHRREGEAPLCLLRVVSVIKTAMIKLLPSVSVCVGIREPTGPRSGLRDCYTCAMGKTLSTVPFSSAAIQFVCALP